jgi:glycosyltransferase involved in cell wall biosynthesis
MSKSSPRLIINGSVLAHPFVGQGAYTLRLIQALQRRAPEEFAIVIPHGNLVPSQVHHAAVLELPRSIELKHSLAREILGNNRLTRFVCKNFPEAIFHSPGPIASRYRPQHTVVTVHDCIYRSFPNYLGRFFVRRIYMRATERFAAGASLVLTDSDFSRDQLIHQVGIEPDRIEVLYPWVSNEFLTPVPDQEIAALRLRYGLPDRFWLYLGGYDYRKNIEFLLEAYAKAASLRSLPPLVLAGTIPSRPSRVTCDVFGTLKRLRLNEAQIRLPGMIPVDELPSIYQSASLLIYPSLMEGFGLPPAEAMAVGTAVLTSNVSSLPEVVQKAECLFDPTDLSSLATKLLTAAEDEAVFSTALPSIFTEDYGISRYLQLIGQIV